MNDPFKIIEPTVISFSGGRTSAYMLWRILQSNQGLPEDAIVCFANTGKEMEETLNFVNDCEVNWNIKINWLEFVNSEETKNRFKVVNYETASRNGEPFELVIKHLGYLPNPVTRFCTTFLKIRVIDAFVKSLGWEHDEKSDWMGIRADEMRRAAKFERNRIPLVSAGITKADVSAFWSINDFDLGLPNNNGTTMHGNCDLCFLKPASQILSLIQEKPSRAIWWANQEIQNKLINLKPDGAKFRKDRPSYSEMMNYAINQYDMFDQNEEPIACFCGD
jgi:3'-phosphoadenosine 5'-phosphosulfate sulfotransferase (PAPS reductase)/FAD synthetase